ncbi:GroES-like protein [Auriculariales sp. MPI-PUGE-AT-0066]|nr:GroES-like protein [Auriculariales sp. MPI-PUGE-AT-0066]
MSATNKVVKLYPPSRDIRVEEVEVPKIQHADDAIVRVHLAGLCGSDLHAYRGHEPYQKEFVCGHEFVGEVIALGDSFKSANSSAQIRGRADLYGTLAVGDKVVSPFTTSCAECQPCRLGFTCRCEQSTLFGTVKLPGAQAQFIRVPIAGGTLIKVTTTTQADLGALPNSSLLLLADILPTGYFATLQLLNHPNLQPLLTRKPFPQFSSLIQSKANLFPPAPAISLQDAPLTLAVVGLGPVGVCALIALLDFLYPTSNTALLDLKPRIIAVDPLPARRTRAAQIISHYWASTDVNGILEVVGNVKAFEMAYGMIKPFGVISSVGVHNHHSQLPVTGGALYDKNVGLVFGRCPVRALMELAADLLHRRVKIFGDGTETVGEPALVERIIGMDEAKHAYEQFESGVWGKVLFDPWK